MAFLIPVAIGAVACGIASLLFEREVKAKVTYSEELAAKGDCLKRQISSDCEVRHIPLNGVDDFIKTRSPKERDLLYRVSKCEKGEELLHKFGFELSEGFCSALLVLFVRDRKKARITITNVTLPFDRNQIKKSNDLKQVLQNLTKREARNLAIEANKNNTKSNYSYVKRGLR